MAFTMNGVGTSVCCSRGDVGWGSSDAMECFVVFFLPIIPYRAMHTYDWNGQQFRYIPIRWSWDLTLRTFVKPWSWGVIALGAVLAVIGVVEINRTVSVALGLLAAGVLFAGVGLLGLLLLHYTDRRNKAIRRVIGGLTIGTCDPAHLTGQLLDQMTGDPRAMYDAETFAEAVEQLLEKGSFAQAMWAARMTVAVEDPSEGERLTDSVLSDPEVQEAILEVQQSPDRWHKAMLTADERQIDVRAPGAETMEPRNEDAPRRKKRREDDEEY